MNATATPLDAYRYGKLITQRQFDAGDKLRDIWHRAGRAPKMTGDLELVSFGHWVRSNTLHSRVSATGTARNSTMKTAGK